MDARTRGAGPGSPDRLPHCRVVWDGAGEVGVWVANGDQPGWAWRQPVEIIGAVADRAFDQVRDEARGAGMALDAVEVLRDPRMIVPLTIAAVVQVAAVHAGIPVLIAKLIGDAAGNLGQRLLAAESGPDRDQAVRYVDFDYDYDTSTGTGRTRPENPAIRRADRTSRHDAIGELLDPRRDRTTRAARGTPAARDLGRGMPQTARPTRAARADTGIARPVPPARSQPTDRGSRSRNVTREQPRSRGDRDGRGGLDGR
jgi:hypothetical protein